MAEPFCWIPRGARDVKKESAEIPKLMFQNHHLGMVWPGFPNSLIAGCSTLAFRGFSFYRHEISSDSSNRCDHRELKFVSITMVD